MVRLPTIGFISTWPVYQGTTMDRYAHSLIQGTSAAAHTLGCNLLLGCGFSVRGNIPQRRSFWPVPGNGWDPADASAGNNWENQALFDYQSRPLPALDLFSRP